MKKKFVLSLAAIGLTTALLLFAACDSDSDNNGQTTAATQTGLESSDEQSDAVIRGFWEENIFASSYLGLRFEAPSNWDITSEEDILAMLELGADLMGASDEFTESIMEAMGLSMLYDMAASNTLSGASVQIILERLDPAAGMMNARQYIELAALGMAIELDDDWTFDTDYEGTTRIGNYEWHSFVATWDFIGMNIQVTQFVNISGGFARIIAITTSNISESVEDILEMFSQY